MNIFATTSAPFQADDIKADQLGSHPGRKTKRNNVIGNAAGASQHGAFADAHMLVHRGVTTDEDVIGDLHMAADQRAVGESDIVADLAVVSDMRIDHQEAAVADCGEPAA